MLLEAIRETRGVSLEDPNVPLGSTTLRELLGAGRATASGVRVTADTALNYSAVWAAVAMITGTVAKLPVKVYQRRSDGAGKDEVRQHRAWELLQSRPHREMSAFSFREALQGHLLLRGNGYALIQEDGGGIESLCPLNPDHMTLVRDPDGNPWWRWHHDGKDDYLPWERVLAIPGMSGDGLHGWSVVKHAREGIALGLAAEEFGNRFFGNGSRPSGFLSHPAALSDEAAKNLKSQWQSAQGGLENAHRVAVLEEGITWQAMGMTAEDSQFLETRKFQITEVARWFNLPPHKLRDLERATFTNVEEQNLEYMEDTIDPWLVRWEQALKYYMLTPRDRANGLFIEFVRSAQLRASTEKRGAYYRERFNVGSITPNQIRALENENPLEGGDTAYVGLNMVPLDQAFSLSVDERAKLLQAEAGVETRGSPQEFRSPGQRIRLVGAFRRLLGRDAERLVNGEIRDLRRAIKRTGDRSSFLDWLEDYYFGSFVEFASGIMAPVFNSYGSAMADTAAAEINLDALPLDPGAYSRDFADAYAVRHAAGSRKQLVALIREGDEYAEQVETRMTEWTEGTDGGRPRHDRIAGQESVRFGEALARAVWVAAGITLFRWRNTGSKQCPYCADLDGKITGASTPFLSAGSGFTPDGADAALTPRNDVFHPPAHRGCDCTIVPERG